MGFLNSIFGSSKIVTQGLDMVDKAFYTDEEKAQDNQKIYAEKIDMKIKMLQAYHPYKVTQRFLAICFVFIYLFIMLNGILGQLYTVISVSDVKSALEFANSMYLGQIVMLIMGFYFGGGFVESFQRTKSGSKNE